MKRTQLYLEEDLWRTLNLLARSRGTTVSELVRQALRDRYMNTLDERRRAMRAFVGSMPREGDEDEIDLRELRRGGRLERLAAD